MSKWTKITLTRFFTNRPVKRQNKSRLDKYWINQDIVFDYTADLAGTGDRSEYISSYWVDSNIVECRQYDTDIEALWCLNPSPPLID